MMENRYMTQKAMFLEREESKKHRILIIIFLILLLLLLVLIIFGVRTGDLVDNNNPYNPGGNLDPTPTVSPTTSPSPSISPTTSPDPIDPTPTTDPTTSPKPTASPTISPKPTGTDKPGSDIVKFYYSDTTGVGNGISIINAVPTDDSVGKLLVGDRNYFDFYITSTTVKRPISYNIIATKSDGSTLDENSVKVYLTKVSGMNEIEIANCYNGNKVKTYGEYGNVDYGFVAGKSLYKETIAANTKNYKSSYRLRIWVNDTAINWENKDFSLKINVYAVEE